MAPWMRQKPRSRQFPLEAMVTPGKRATPHSGSNSDHIESVTFSITPEVNVKPCLREGFFPEQ